MSGVLEEKGKPSSNIGLLTPSEIQTNSFANLIAANKKPFDSFANLFLTSDIPQGFSAYRSTSRPPAAATTAAVPAVTTMMQGGVTYGTWATEITQRRNETGSDSLFSGNYHWSVPIVGLAGRAGHDFGLSLSYDSHVWVKAYGMSLNGGDYLLGNPGTGFNVGLPVIDNSLHYARNGATAYTLMLPSGKAIELIRRGGSTAFQIYESQDGSLLRMSVASSDRRLYFPNGTRMIFNSSFQCQEIQDRNGNLIIASYDAPGGNLSKVTDTLGREINFTYNAYFQISDNTQSRRDENNAPVTVTLAHFGYQDFFVKTNFSGVSSNIPQNTLMPLLKTVQLASGSVYSFEYNSYVQVR